MVRDVANALLPTTREARKVAAPKVGTEHSLGACSEGRAD